MKFNFSKEDKDKIHLFAQELEVLYELFNWHWHSNRRPPTAEKIEESIYELARVAEGNGPITSGGLTVELNDDGCLEIKWSIEKCLYLT